MPNLAKKPDGELVSVADVGELFTEKEELRCPYCGGILKYRRESKTDRGTTRTKPHFWHPDSNNQIVRECSTSQESHTHVQMKRAVVHEFKKSFPSKQIHLETPVGEYIADVVLEFPQHYPYNGIAVEVQHRNTTKQIQKVTLNYLSQGFLVIWIVNTEEQLHYYTVKQSIDDLTDFSFTPGRFDPEPDVIQKEVFLGTVISHAWFSQNTLPPFEDIVGYQRTLPEYSSETSVFQANTVRMKKLLTSTGKDTAEFWRKYDPNQYIE